MPARLIVNADDFGLTTGVNRAIGELHRAGVLTSATLMANGPAFDNAVEVARVNPQLGVGCHIVLADGVPLAPLNLIPGLLGTGGKALRPSIAEFVRALLCGAITPREIELEAECQIRRVQATGLRITHLDTHKHTHIFTGVSSVLMKLAQRHAIPAIRNPFEPPFSLALRHGRWARRMAVHASSILRPRFESMLQTRADLATTDGTIGICATGTLTIATVQQLLRALPEHGTYELCCHPAYNDRDLARVNTRLRAERNVEREALLAVLPGLGAQSAAPQLIHYGSLPNAPENG